MKDKLLAVEATTGVVWLFWKENARHNGTEDPGHQPIVPYDDRLGVARGEALITWRTNGIDFVGTQEGLKERTEASKREATVDVEAVQKGDLEEEKTTAKTCRATKHANKSKAVGNQPRSELCTEPGARPTHSISIHGAMFPGSSSVFLGNNENLGWAHTFNHLDLVDVFELEMHPKKKRMYKYNGEWKQLEKRPVWLKVKLAKGIILPVKKMTYWSVYGATLKSPNGNYYAVKLPGNERVRVGEQWYRMDKASNYDEFYEALRMESISMFNIIYSDKDDNVLYLNNCVMPKRHEGVDYSRVVKSNSDKTLWSEFHDVEDLVQTYNPDCGWVFNTNNNPAHATVISEWQNLEDWPAYYGWDDKGENNRAERFLEMMKEPESDKISYERMKEIKFDYEFPACGAYQNSIENLFHVNPNEHPEMSALITAINEWDKRGNKENKGAGAYLITFQKLFSMMGFADGEFKKAVCIPDTSYLTALRWAQNEIDTHYGGEIPALGEVQRHVRGDVNIPLSGFPDALAANYNEEWKDGRYKPWVADSYVHFAQWKDGKLVRMETLHPFGASTRPDSPHYTDQMQLYADQKTKPMTLDKAKIMSEAKSVYHPH